MEELLAETSVQKFKKSFRFFVFTVRFSGVRGFSSERYGELPKMWLHSTSR
jgi:hypothetical protein